MTSGLGAGRHGNEGKEARGGGEVFLCFWISRRWVDRTALAERRRGSFSTFLQGGAGSFFPTEAPIAEGHENGAEGFSFFGELIALPFSAFEGGDLLDDAGGEESGESVAEDVGGNALRGGGEILEAGSAQEQVADDEEGPSVA